MGTTRFSTQNLGIYRLGYAQGSIINLHMSLVSSCNIYGTLHEDCTKCAISAVSMACCYSNKKNS